jgi:hypothetical protein
VEGRVAFSGFPAENKNARKFLRQNSFSPKIDRPEKVSGRFFWHRFFLAAKIMTPIFFQAKKRSASFFSRQKRIPPVRPRFPVGSPQ